MSVTDQQLIAGPAVVRQKVSVPLYCPYYQWDERGQGSLDYYRHAPFTHNPFTLPALGLSGSPVLMDAEGRFFGFMDYAAVERCWFTFNGNELAINVPEGQTLFVGSAGSADAHWRAYNTQVMRRLDYKPLADPPAFWSDIEYCTWVEQGHEARRLSDGGTPRHTHDVLTDRFVRDYVGKLREWGYPPGKFTLDHGWGVGARGIGFGSWRVDPEKFPDLRKTCDFLRNSGFTPGLWIALPKIHPDSDAARKYPDLLGAMWAWDFRDGKPASMHFLADCPALDDYCRETLAPYHAMGFRKFKIDMSYNFKHDMIPIHRAAYTAAKQIDPSIEMEFHVPDIFAMRYGDVIRTNDIWCTPYLPWQSLTAERYKVCYRSAPGRIINRDHIGGNHHIYTTEATFLEHLRTYEQGTGYPVVSLLPHHYGRRCVEALGDYLWRYHKSARNTISDFFEE